MKDLHFVLAKRLAKILDSQFELFGIRFGLDPILDLIPGLGDVLAVTLGLYVLYVAKRFRMPKILINRMVVNIIIDFVIGLVPVLGAVGTVFFRSNLMNVKIMEEFLREVKIEEGEIIG